MNNQAIKRIIAAALAMAISLGAAPPIGAIGAAEPIGISQAAEKVQPDLSNLESPPPSPPRSGRQPLALVERDAPAAEPRREIRPSLTRGTTTQDHGSPLTIGSTLNVNLQINANGIPGIIQSVYTKVYKNSSPLVSVLDQNSSNPSTVYFNSNAYAITGALNAAITEMESEAYSAIGEPAWVNGWDINEIKVILTPLNDPSSSGVLLGYFDPNDFPGGGPANSDYYLYIDSSEVSGGGYERASNTGTRDLFLGTILHEYAHLVNFSVGFREAGNIGDAGMEIWLDEAIATTVAYNYSGTFEQPYLDAFLEQDFEVGVGYAPRDDQWENAGQWIDANYGAAALMMLDLNQFEPHHGEPTMKRIINYNRGTNDYANSLNAMGDSYSALGSFNDFFTQFNLDVAVDNDATDHGGALTGLESEFYALEAIDYIWQERHDGSGFAGVTALAPDTSTALSAAFGNRSYFSHIYLADAVGSDRSKAEITVTSAAQTDYYLIAPYNMTDVDTDDKWIDCPKQAKKLTEGVPQTVQVGTNNRFAVLAIQYGGSLAAGAEIRYKSLSSAADITSFQLEGEDGVINGDSIAVTVPLGSDVSNAAPTIAVSPGAAVSPLSGVAQDFRVPVQYTVTAEGGTEKTYTVTVQVQQSDSKAITAFTIPGQAGATVIDEANGAIGLTMPFGTEVTGLAPTITHTGDYVTPASGAAQDFTGPVTYTVTALDSTTKSYLVTVSLGGAPPSGGDLPAVDLTALTVAEGGTNTFAVSLGSGSNGAESAVIRSSDEGVAVASPGSLTFSGPVEVVGVGQGNATISIGYSGGARHGQADTVQVTVTESGGVNPPGPPNNSGGGSSRSDSGSSRSWVPLATAPTEYIIDQAEMRRLIAAADKNGRDFARASSSLPATVRGNAWQLLGEREFVARTTIDRVVQVQLTFPEPSKLTAEMKVSGFVTGAAADSRKAFFERWFRNQLRVIHFDHSGGWGQPMEVAAKVDLTGMDTAKLAFYSYDKATNRYSRIENPAYWIDQHGYLHFTTELAGDIIISENALVRIF